MDSHIAYIRLKNWNCCVFLRLSIWLIWFLHILTYFCGVTHEKYKDDTTKETCHCIVTSVLTANGVVQMGMPWSKKLVSIKSLTGKQFFHLKHKRKYLLLSPLNSSVYDIIKNCEKKNWYEAHYQAVAELKIFSVRLE